MDVPVGCSITRVRKSSKYDFPENIESFAVDLIPLLELAWKGKELMKKTMVDINSRKRKSVDISIPEDDILSTLPSSFYSCNSTKIN
jgi:hypothetical protein